MEDEATPVPKTPMTDEERMKLAAKLDSELEDFMSGLEKRRYAEGWPEDRWQEEMEKHPFFMTKVPEEGEEMSPLIQGLTQLKYDETDNTPTELAVAYKDDGNFYFKCRKYRSAIIGYTEGLKKRCGDASVESQLHNNRAAAHFELGNLRSCIADCTAALALKPDYHKARHRMAQCHHRLGKLDDCVAACDEILRRCRDDNRATELRKKALADKKFHDRDERKKKSIDGKKVKEELDLGVAIKQRGIKVITGSQGDVYPGAVQSRVRLVNDRLVWPVVFLYPEVSSSDLVREFHEDTTFAEQLVEMFETCPDWDKNQVYRPDRLKVYYESKDKQRLFPVDLNLTLGDVLPCKNLEVRCGTPGFIIVVDGSVTEKKLLETYE